MAIVKNLSKFRLMLALEISEFSELSEFFIVSIKSVVSLLNSSSLLYPKGIK